MSAEELAEIQAVLGEDAAQAAQPNAVLSEPAPSSGVLGAVQSLNPDLSFILDASLAAFSAEEPLQSGGHDPTKTGFNFQQLEMSVGAAVDPYFRFDANIVFSQFGVEVEEAYATTLDLPLNLQVRAGQFLTRFGRINPTHPHSWDFVDQPFMLGRIFGGEGNRGLGVEASWLAPLPWFVEVIGSATDAAGGATARSFFGDRNLGVRTPLDFQLTGAVKQFFPLSDDTSLLWGVSYATGPNSTGHRNRTDVFGTDVYIKFRPVTAASNTVVALQAEAFYRRRQVPNDVLQDVGGYAQVLWKFAQRWGTAMRYEFGTAAYDGLGNKAVDFLDPEWMDMRQRISANVTFWPSEFSRIRLQGAADAPEWRDETDFSAFLQLEVLVGAHGAHLF
ncbi:zinc-regulated TonB-dependent outer membrane receptor [Myxococcus sp. AB036A]|uniref:zinc-regulated TonB-dependent outer membrane receptor n=1 Tax=Myxococcus sp. AB036A TaxID=2562793 RepID=UPI001E64C26B|nr:zinc-regulated TonB-dependent outer membrane receptor [Myxococcus sp. AB036A]